MSALRRFIFSCLTALIIGWFIYGIGFLLTLTLKALLHYGPWAIVAALLAGWIGLVWSLRNKR